MNTIIFMVSLALLLTSGFVVSYLWALSRGQFDDLETPAHRILKDDFNAKNYNEGNEYGK